MKAQMSMRSCVCFILMLGMAPAVLHAQVLDAPDSGDTFGASIVQGDFNGDGLVDLAVGVPAESFNGLPKVGAVNILYAGTAGLTDENNQFWHQDTAGFVNGGEAGDAYGQVLCPGDFNGDGYADLAIAATGKSIDGQVRSGAVFVLYGSPEGLTSALRQEWHQDLDSLTGKGEDADAFGNALASGDFNADGYEDLAVGIPGKNVGSALGAGRILILPGSAAGLTAEGHQGIDQATPDVSGTEETGDQFGGALVTGDFNGDGYMDLAVGIPGEDRGDLTDSGAAQILYGSASGLAGVGNQIFDQEIVGEAGAAEAGDRLGATLAAGDFNKDGITDLVIGVPGEDVAGQEDAGSLLVLYGTANRLQGTGSLDLHQDVPGMHDAVQAGDLFGDALAAADFNGDGYTDLAVGVPKEDLDGVTDAGAVVLLTGSGNGLTVDGTQFWRQDMALAPLAPGDNFGQALTAGDFNGDGYADLGVGIPFKDMPGVTDVGAVGVLLGSTIGLSAVGAQLWDQNSNPRSVDTEPDAPGVPTGFQLLQNYPNPFNPTTTITYQLNTPSTVRLEVFDALGKPVYVLARGKQPAGAYQVQWNGLDFNGNELGSGVYLYRLDVNGNRQARQMLLLR